jgi:hypothetical protein
MSHPHLRFFGLAISALMMSTPQCFAQAPKEQTKKVSPGKSALPKTLWGDPDLEGAWTSDDAFGVPFERPVELGNRKFLNDKELAERASENDLIQSKIESGERPNAGFWARQKGVDAAAVPANWVEFARHTSRQSSLVVDPPDGRIPPLTEEAKALRAKMPAYFNMRPASWEDTTMYDRCISRGVTGSIVPAIYGNGTQIVQAPGMVAIRNEMIHEVRIVPLDGTPHPSSGLRTYMGDSRGHWEGNALVVETTNFIGGRLSAGAGTPYSEDLKIVERFTRTDDRSVQYEATINDPKTYTAPWTISFPLTREPGYQIFEYACHEGNYAMRNRLSAARAEERAEGSR